MKPFIKPLPETFIFTPNTIICTSAKDAARLLEKDFPDVAKELDLIEYRPITSLSFFVKSEFKELTQSFGMLIPQKYGRKILGIIHQSEIFPENYKAHCYSVICKGILNRDEIFKELERIIPAFNSNNILESRLSQWENGLPLYNENRHQSLKKIEALLAERPGLVLFGNYTKGISLRSMIEQTRKELF